MTKLITEILCDFHIFFAYRFLLKCIATNLKYQIDLLGIANGIYKKECVLPKDIDGEIKRTIKRDYLFNLRTMDGQYNIIPWYGVLCVPHVYFVSFFLEKYLIFFQLFQNLQFKLCKHQFVCAAYTHKYMLSEEKTNHKKISSIENC